MNSKDLKETTGTAGQRRSHLFSPPCCKPDVRNALTSTVVHTCSLSFSSAKIGGLASRRGQGELDQDSENPISQ